MTEKDDISIAEKIKEQVIKHFDAGIIPKENSDIVKLYKQIISDLNINKSWRAEAKKIILAVMQEKNLLIASRELAQESAHDLEIERAPPLQETPQITIEQIAKPDQFRNIPVQSPHGTMPRGFVPQDQTAPQVLTPATHTMQTTEETPRTPLTEIQIKNQKTFIKDSFGFVTELYVAMGLVEGSEEEKQEQAKPRPIAEFKESVDGYAERVSQHLVDNNIALPQWLSLVGIFGSGIMIFVIPLLKFAFVNKGNNGKKPKFDSELDKVEVEIKT